MTTMVPLDIESLQDAVRKGLRPSVLPVIQIMRHEGIKRACSPT